MAQDGLNKSSQSIFMPFSMCKPFKDKLPPNIQNLLVKLADNKETARDVAHAVADNFNKLRENVRNDFKKD